MRKSNIFTSMEQVLGDIENLLDRANDNYKGTSEELAIYMQECLDEDKEPDKWTLEYKTDNNEVALAKIHLLESAYNYIYENFHKITKDL